MTAVSDEEYGRQLARRTPPASHEALEQAARIRASWIHEQQTNEAEEAA